MTQEIPLPVTVGSAPGASDGAVPSQKHEIPLEVYLASERMPECHQVVIVAGGLACWTGSTWISKTGDDTGRVIDWRVRWWAPLMYERDISDAIAKRTAFALRHLVDLVNVLAGRVAYYTGKPVPNVIRDAGNKIDSEKEPL